VGRLLNCHPIQAEYLQNKIKGIATNEHVVILHGSGESAYHETDIVSKHCGKIYQGYQPSPSDLIYLNTYHFQRPI
jgi:hypothetical protein